MKWAVSGLKYRLTTLQESQDLVFHSLVQPGDASVLFSPTSQGTTRPDWSWMDGEPSVMARLGGQEAPPSLSPCEVSRMGPGTAAGVSPASKCPGKVVVMRQV